MQLHEWTYRFNLHAVRYTHVLTLSTYMQSDTHTYLPFQLTCSQIHTYTYPVNLHAVRSNMYLAVQLTCSQIKHVLSGSTYMQSATRMYLPFQLTCSQIHTRTYHFHFYRLHQLDHRHLDLSVPCQQLYNLRRQNTSAAVVGW